MPVRNLQQAGQHADYDRLLDALCREWQHPDPGAIEPVILEERDGAGRLMHFYVVWDEWGELDAVERSAMIMDAANQRYGATGTGNVTIAMGLTKAEADRLRIKY